MIESLREIAETGTVYEVLNSLFVQTGLLSLLQAENTPESMARHDNLQELLSMARDFSDHNPDAGMLGDFLENIALASDYDETQESDNFVSLMTVHASKGLEFPVVFITGLEERLFPLNCYEPEQMEEERRLFYVAVTRAREKIFLSWAQSRYLYGQPQHCLRSKFINEIDGDIVHTESGRVHGGGAGAAVSVRRTEPVRHSGGGAPPVREKEGMRKGTRVHHAVFGPGTVLELQGRGTQQKAKILFRGSGEKTLMVQYANLKVLP